MRLLTRKNRQVHRSPGFISFALIVCAMIFFGWLVCYSTESHSRFYLPVVAMICTAAIIGSLMRHGHR